METEPTAEPSSDTKTVALPQGRKPASGKRGFKKWLRGTISGWRASDATATHAVAARDARVSGPHDLLGQALPPPDQRFDAQGEIARGGMGAIGTVYDGALRRQVAFKTLHPHLVGEPEVVRSFIREAQVTGQLDHPGIVPVHDIGRTAEGRPFFSMKMVKGRTLADVLEALPPGRLDRSSLLDLLEIVVKVCDALAFAHEHGLIHCDIKPQNIMVGAFGQVYLMDWGIARFARADGDHTGAESLSSSFEDLPRTGVSGTPSYMSPEQASADYDALGPRSDVFAMGGVLYYLLSHRPPYEGELSKVLALAQRGAFTPLRDVVPAGSVPRELERITMTAMARRPEDRYATVLEMRQDLVSFQRGGALPRRRYQKGQDIITEGDRGEEAYVIESGRCEAYRVRDGQRESVGTIEAGECFGEIALLADTPRTTNVVALDDTTVLVIARRELEEETGAMPRWVGVFLRTLAERFRDRANPRR